MRFCLIDSITELERGKRISAAKGVSLAEEYLADHFPSFPVLPGVFILQGLIEAATWLAYDALDFAPVVILLRSAKNVTYKSFVKPGNLLRLEVACRLMTPERSEYEGTGYCALEEMVRARFELRHLWAEQDSRVGQAVRPPVLDQRKARFHQMLQRA